MLIHILLLFFINYVKWNQLFKNFNRFRNQINNLEKHYAPFLQLLIPANFNIDKSKKVLKRYNINDAEETLNRPVYYFINTQLIFADSNASFNERRWKTTYSTYRFDYSGYSIRLLQRWVSYKGTESCAWRWINRTRYNVLHVLLGLRHYWDTV